MRKIMIKIFTNEKSVNVSVEGSSDNKDNEMEDFISNHIRVAIDNAMRDLESFSALKKGE